MLIQRESETQRRWKTFTVLHGIKSRSKIQFYSNSPKVILQFLFSYHLTALKGNDKNIIEATWGQRDNMEASHMVP